MAFRCLFQLQRVYDDPLFAQFTVATTSTTMKTYVLGFVFGVTVLLPWDLESPILVRLSKCTLLKNEMIERFCYQLLLLLLKVSFNRSVPPRNTNQILC